MADIFNISLSGLQVFQNLLATTSHNISNVNTDGYSRQKVDLSTRDASYTGVGYIGSGVRVASIQREFDKYIDNQVVANTSFFSQLDELHALSSQLDNLVADPVAGLSPGIQNFFNAIQNVSDDPASLPARQLLLSDAQFLVERFGYFDRRFNDLLSDANATFENGVAAINSLAQNIADLNKQISTAIGNPNSQPVNDLLDKRQQYVVQLSEYVAVNTIQQEDGSLNVFIGNGQGLVVGYDPQTLSVANNKYDPTHKDVFVANGAVAVNVTKQLSGGSLGAAVNFVDQVLTPARNALGRIALSISDTVNSQHRLGMDLNGALGQNFFGAVNSPNFGVVVSGASDNSTIGSGVVTAQINSVSNLSASDYLLRYAGANQYILTRTSDNRVFNLDASAGYPFTSASIDGVNINIASAPAVGDSWRIQPTANAARGITLAISDPRLVAAALPVRATASLSNSGNAQINATSVSDASVYVPDDYRILLGDNANAVADGGATRGTLTDNNADSTLQYELRVNGVLVYTQNEAAAPLANVSALAAQINTQVANTGVRAYLNAAGTSMYLMNEPPSSANIVVNETLNTTAGVVENGDTVTGYFGTALTGVANPTGTITYTSPADSFTVVNSLGNPIASGAYTSGAMINFNGIQTAINGNADLGDTFNVSPNTNGVSDNRNMLALGALQSSLTMVGGTASYLDAYGSMVADVGTYTRKTELTRDAQEILLRQSVEAREAKSGVNLDEEAANIVRFQQAYQAVAQVIAIADSLFQTLLSVVGRR